MSDPTSTSFLDNFEETPHQHFNAFTDYARWASNEIAQTLMQRAIGQDAAIEGPNFDCTWREDDCSEYVTRCNHRFVFIDGTFQENGFLFCPYCGGHITSHLHETGTDE